MDATMTMDTAAELALLHEKVDRLTLLLEAQEKRARALEELRDDMMPMVNQGIKIAIDELAEIDSDFKLEDLMFLLKRMLRNTHLVNKMMDQLEALSALADEAELLGPQVFRTMVETLDRMERDGYFRFAEGGMYIMAQVVSSFDEDDVRALGDNIVTILQTVRNMTQPEIMALANNAVDAIEAPIEEAPSTLSLLRQMNDPQVRRGMARTLNLLKSLDEQQTASMN